jgi:HAD superfamily hydrolase (TIGR01509 family)
MAAATARNIQAVLFDMDGTLLDSVGPTLEAYVSTVRECGGPATTAEDVLATFPAGSTRAVLTVLLGRPAGDDDMVCFSRHLEMAAAAMSPYDGIDAALRALAGTVPIGVVTGATQRTARLLLERTGLLQYFGVVVGGDEVANAKPDPECIVLGCRRIEVEPGHAAYVGDAPTDLEAARRAGAVPVAVAWGHHYDAEIPADLVLRTPAEILGILR